MAKVVFVLGAGSSKAAGAPLMNEFFDVADRLYAKGNLGNSTQDFQKVAKARSNLQQVHSKCELDLANLETVFTALDLAKTLGKLPGYSSDEEIDQVLESLKRVIGTTLEHSIRFPNRVDSGLQATGEHLAFADLIKSLRDLRPAVSCAVITFNYDVLLDFAFLHAGLPFSYFLGAEQGNPVPLLKLHGSLNWVRDKSDLVTPISLSGISQIFIRPIPDKDRSLPVKAFVESEITRRKLDCSADPIIVPPTWTKGDHQRNLGAVWKKAASELQDAEHIVVAGYSLPETDLFFRHLYALGTVGETLLKGFHVYDPSSSASKRFEAMLGPGTRSRFSPSDLRFEKAITQMKKDLMRHFS